MKVDDIKSGMRIVVTAVTVQEKGADRLVAKTIELGTSATSK
jgi:hypothetical protein